MQKVKITSEPYRIEKYDLLTISYLPAKTKQGFIILFASHGEWSNTPLSAWVEGKEYWVRLERGHLVLLKEKES